MEDVDRTKYNRMMKLNTLKSKCGPSTKVTQNLYHTLHNVFFLINLANMPCNCRQERDDGIASKTLDWI